MNTPDSLDSHSLAALSSFLVKLADCDETAFTAKRLGNFPNNSRGLNMCVERGILDTETQTKGGNEITLYTITSYGEEVAERILGIIRQ